MTVVLCVVLGAGIGMVLGGLGGGGAVLAVPALFYVVGQTAHEAATGSLIVVGLSAAVALIVPARAGLVRWRTGMLVAGAGAGTAARGALLSPLIPPRVELLALACVMAACGVGLLLRGRVPARQVEAPGAAGGGRLARALGVGAAVGFLTGLLGVGGGFLVVPALVLALRMPMRSAAATSIFVTAVNCAAALGPRLVGAQLDWTVIVPFSAAAIGGAVLGARIGARVSGPALSRAFAALVLAVASFTALHTLAT